jgi:uncharacterized protein YjiS (DUF1127 family)
MSQATCHAAPLRACTPAVGRARARNALPAQRDLTGFAAALDRLARLWRRRAAIRELDRLSDRELRDIGIERGDVEAVVDELMTSSRKS